MRRRALVRMMTVACVCVLSLAARAEDSKPTAEEVKALTLQAAQLVADKGIEQARAVFYQDGEYKHDEIYVSVIDTKGAWVIYPPKPAGEGKVILTLQDADGKFLVQDILKVAADAPEGGWVDYRWKNPVTNLIQAKQSFVKKAGGSDYVVYVGIYK